MKLLKEIYKPELKEQNLQTQELTTIILEPWHAQPYAELMAIVSMLEALNVLTQTFHWKTGGESFFSDHTLYQRIYEAITPQIDLVGEKAVGLGSSNLSDPERVVNGMDKFLEFVYTNNKVVHGAKDYNQVMARIALFSVRKFVETTEKFMVMLDNQGLLTRGLENMLEGILDEHEGFVYLLKQRTETHS